MPACPEATHCETTSCPSAPKSREGGPRFGHRAHSGGSGPSVRCCSDPAVERADRRRRADSLLSNGSVSPGGGTTATDLHASRRLQLVRTRRGTPSRSGRRRAATPSRLLSSPSGNHARRDVAGLARSLPVGSWQVTFHVTISADPQPVPLTDRSSRSTLAAADPDTLAHAEPHPSTDAPPQPAARPLRHRPEPRRPGTSRAHGARSAARRTSWRCRSDRPAELVGVPEWHRRGSLGNAWPKGDTRREQRPGPVARSVRSGCQRRPDGAANPAARAIPDRRRSDERRRSERARPPVVRHPPAPGPLGVRSARLRSSDTVRRR